jgi:hypothetical protein
MPNPSKKPLPCFGLLIQSFKGGQRRKKYLILLALPREAREVRKLNNLHKGLGQDCAMSAFDQARADRPKAAPVTKRLSIRLCKL